ncbi:FecCD family ABC transporter permease [Paenibacillus wulumuqiensis]|uniref:FecCD family ABC transporter permease n=1 Tax=Paenibacillus wulumuqiensis TaxID=1567107 RepID=UPI000619B30C|nr:iron ABC transporter permease [Paenibacillus wulumuqiensis]
MLFGRQLRIGIWLLAAAVGLLLSIFLAVSYGAKELTLAAVWSAVWHYNPDLTAHQIVHDLRLPRVLGAVVTGMAFGAAGAMMQGVTRNPMADTGILGINAGSAAVVALSFAFLPQISYSRLMLLSFAGAALATLLIVLLGSATPGGLTSMKLTIAGAVIAAMLHSFSTGVAIYFDLSQDLAFWYAGGVSGVTWAQLKLMTPVIMLAIMWAMLLGRPITFLSLGDESAVNLGINVRYIRVMALTVVVILAGVSVSAAGSISFVGLVVPHMARRLIGVDYRAVIPLSALLGAVLLVWADFASRMVQPPREFAIGAMVAIVGVPFFLYLARREGREL